VGQLTIDHRGTKNPDGTKGTLVTLDTVACKHCGKVIAVIIGPVKEYVGKRRCNRCDGPICEYCASLGFCNPLPARIDHAVKVGQWEEEWRHEYKILPN
jgi:hypothetical protein